MPTKLRLDAIGQIPVHDAELRNFQVMPEKDGNLTVILELLLHEDESLVPLGEYGIQSRHIRVSFRDALQVGANLLGLMTSMELISDWEVNAESDLLNKLAASGFGISASAAQHSIVFSGGSKLEIVSDFVLLEEASAAL